MPTAKYNKPPVNEVVMGVVFTPIELLRSEYIGIFWSKIKDKFPNSQQAPNFGQLTSIKGEIYPAPRFWFISETFDKLIQIQNNMFLCNWRKVPGGPQYPEYSEMRILFEKNYNIFLEFLKQNNVAKLEPIEYQFTYINNLYLGGELKEPSELPGIINGLEFPETLSQKSSNEYNLNYHYELPDYTKGTFYIKFATAIDNNTKKDMVVFENGARSLKNPDIDIFNWLDYAHTVTVDNFEKITDGEIQNKLWEKENA